MGIVRQQEQDLTGFVPVEEIDRGQEPDRMEFAQVEVIDRYFARGETVREQIGLEEIGPEQGLVLTVREWELTDQEPALMEDVPVVEGDLVQVTDLASVTGPVSGIVPVREHDREKDLIVPEVDVQGIGPEVGVLTSEIAPVTVREIVPASVIAPLAPDRENAPLLAVAPVTGVQVQVVPVMDDPAQVDRVMVVRDPAPAMDDLESGVPTLIVIDVIGTGVIGLATAITMDCVPVLAGTIPDGTGQTGAGDHPVPTGDITGQIMVSIDAIMAGITDHGADTGEAAGMLRSSGEEQRAGDWERTPQTGVMLIIILTMLCRLRPMSFMTMHSPSPSPYMMTSIQHPERLLRRIRISIRDWLSLKLEIMRIPCRCLMPH